MPNRRIASGAFFVLLSALLLYIACFAPHNTDKYTYNPCGNRQIICIFGSVTEKTYDKGLPFTWQTVEIESSGNNISSNTYNDNLSAQLLITDVSLAEAVAVLITFVIYKRFLNKSS